jgi:hypothetical protein
MPFIIGAKMQAGAASTDASGNATVAFPEPFSTVPKVFLQGVDASARGIVLDVVSVSATGFSVKARKVTGMGTGSAGDHFHSVGVSGTTGTASAYLDAITSITTGTCPAGHANCVVTSYASTPVADSVHTHSCSWTNYTGTTGAHTHGVDAPALSVSFYWLAVEV